MVNSKLKNIIKKLILKETFDYSRDFEFSDFGDDDERKRNLRNYLASKNLSNATIDGATLKNFPEKGDEISLFSVNVRDLNPVQRAMLKQSLNNGNIKYKVKSGVVSFSRKDAERIIYEIDKLIESEYEDATEAYKEYFFKYGDFDRYGKPIENEMTKRFQRKLLEELKTKENFAHDLARKMAIAIRDNYNDRSMDEAYVDASGRLRDFNPYFPSQEDKDIYTDPNLPVKNRPRLETGGELVNIVVSKPSHKLIMRDVMQIAKTKGSPKRLAKLTNVKFTKYGDTDKWGISSDDVLVVKDILENFYERGIIKLEDLTQIEDIIGL